MEYHQVSSDMVIRVGNCTLKEKMDIFQISIFGLTDLIRPL